MKKRILLLILPFLAVVLEVLPYGAVLNFYDPDVGVTRITYSYFDLTPFGYANFAPLICAVMTCILLLLGALYFVLGSKRLCRTCVLLSLAVFVVSAMPLFIGAYSAIGGVISAVLLADTVCAFILYRKVHDKETM